MRFRIYYDDGSTYSGDPFYARPYGGICIAQEHPDPPGFRIRQYHGYFVWKDERWYECDYGGLWDYWHMHIGPKVSVHGRYVRDELFYATIARAEREGLG